MRQPEVLEPTIFVIFGITGDLSRRYLLPSLSAIVKDSRVKDNFLILGISRRSVAIEEVIPAGESNLRHKSLMFQMNVDEPADYQRLKTEIARLKKDLGASAQVIFYLVVPPPGVPRIVAQLGQAGLNDKSVKLLLEKPFGTDLSSAKQLIDQTATHFKEEQVYRIDHYLAKEMAQNLTVFLGSNSIFRNSWNHNFIDRIEIDILEEIGIEGREDFYENTGALRDIIQSHGLQLAALVLMEPCSDIFDFEEIPRRRLGALKQLSSEPSKVVRAQYEDYAGEVGHKSGVETFVSLQLRSADPRWKNVPITMVTGKRLNRRLTEVRVFFKPTRKERPNSLRLRVQPKEGIELDLWVKSPGYARRLKQLPLDFSYHQHFKRLPNAYEQVLFDAMTGNHSLFAGSGEIIASWEVLEPIIRSWKKSGSALKTYTAGADPGRIIDADI